MIAAAPSSGSFSQNVLWISSPVHVQSFQRVLEKIDSISNLTVTRWINRALLSLLEPLRKKCERNTTQRNCKPNVQWNSELEKKFDIVLKKNIIRPKIQRLFLFAKQGEVLSSLFRLFFLLIQSLRLSLYCTSCLILFVLYFVIANVMRPEILVNQKFQCGSVRNSSIPRAHRKTKSVRQRSLAGARSKETFERANVSDWVREKETGASTRKKQTNNWIRGDGMFYWEGARQIIERKFYF